MYRVSPSLSLSSISFEREKKKIPRDDMISRGTDREFPLKEKAKGNRRDSKPALITLFRHVREIR